MGYKSEMGCPCDGGNFASTIMNFLLMEVLQCLKRPSKTRSVTFDPNPRIIPGIKVNYLHLRRVNQAETLEKPHDSGIEFWLRLQCGVGRRKRVQPFDYPILG